VNCYYSLTLAPFGINTGWFDDPDNMASVMRGIEDAKQGRTKAYTIDEMRKMLNI